MAKVGRARLALAFLVLVALSGCSTLDFRMKPYACDAGKCEINAYHHIVSDLHGAYRPMVGADLQYAAKSENRRGDSPEDWARQARDNTALYAGYNGLLAAIESEMLATSGLRHAHCRALGYAIKESPTLKVLVFLHGGLNHPKYNDERLDKRLCAIVADGYYPLFVSWRSGVFVSLKDRYRRVRDGGLAEGLLGEVRGKLYFVADVLGGVAAFPETAWDSTAEFFLSTREGRNGPERDRGSYDEFLPQTLAWEPGQDFTATQKGLLAAKKIVPGAARVITVPLTQGLGTQAWRMMVRRTTNVMVMEADSFHDNADYCGAECNYAQGNGALAVLGRHLEHVARVIAAQDGPPQCRRGPANMEIMLVGHSMGAILANRFVATFPELPITRIVQMGAADSVANWLDTTGAWLKDHPQAQFYNLVLHPTHEEREDAALHLIPEGSLLTWLDEMFATPDHVLDRRSGRWKNARHLLPLYRELGNAHLKVFPIDGPGNGGLPRKHGDFPEGVFWRPEFYWRNSLVEDVATRATPWEGAPCRANQG